MKTFTAKDGSEITIRNATAADMVEAADTFRQVASEKKFLQTEFVDEGTATRWAETWKTNGEESLFAIALSGDKMLGGLVLTRNSKATKNDHVRVLGMWIIDEYRQIGIGKNLMDYGLEWARSKKWLRKIILGVYSSNLRAVNLYFNYGFTVEGSIRGMALIDGEYVDEITMSLDLIG